MKSLNQFVNESGVTTPAYVKNPDKFQKIEDFTKNFAKDIVKEMEGLCDNDDQKGDFLDSLIRNIWFEMPKGIRRKVLLPVLQNFLDQ